MAKKIIKTECDSCEGTGLYCGFCEAKEEAVICLDCDGTGCKEIYYTPFKKRKGKRGIKKIYNSRGRFLVTGAGPMKKAITYQEFQKGKMP